MKMFIAITVCWILQGCGRTLTVYYRTSPRRVEVRKQVSPSSLFVLAVRTMSGEIDVHLKQASRVTLRRSLYYNSTAIIYDHSGSAGIKALEMLTGLMVALVPVMFWDFDAQIDGKDAIDRKVVRRRGMLLGLLDPTTSVFTIQKRVEPVVTEQIFRDRPVVREYEIRVPAPSTAVAFRVLDPASNELARGSVITDLYGELQIRGAFPRAVAVELSTEGAGAVVVPIQPITAVTDAAAVEPAAIPRVRTSAVLANDGWAKRSQAGGFLPRLTWTFNIPNLIPNLSDGPTLFGEVRLGRKQSLGMLVGRESFSSDLPLDVRANRLDEIGGYARYYVTGQVGTGFHLGLEAVRGFSDIGSRTGRLSLVSYGLTFGYTYTFDWGFTFEVATSQRGLKLDDPVVPRLLDWGWRPTVHVSVGWSF
jgi:hypothetical protein